jgi:hypothetical protein
MSILPFDIDISREHNICQRFLFNVHLFHIAVRKLKKFFLKIIFVMGFPLLYFSQKMDNILKFRIIFLSGILTGISPLTDQSQSLYFLKHIKPSTFEWLNQKMC